jgi:hypothetical protein
LIAAEGTRVAIWAVDGLQFESESRGNGELIHSLDVSADGRHLLVGYESGTIQVWDLARLMGWRAPSF